MESNEEKILKVAVKAAEFIRDELKKSGLSNYALVDVAECVMAAGNASRRELITESLKKA